MPSHYDTETRAQVLALARQGKTGQQVADETNLPHRTVARWIAQARELAQAEGRDPMLVDGEYRLAYMAQAINERQLQELAQLADAGKSTLGYIFPANALRGTAIDKTMKERELAQRYRGAHATQALADAIARLSQLDTSQLAQIIDGEVRELPDPDQE